MVSYRTMVIGCRAEVFEGLARVEKGRGVGRFGKGRRIRVWLIEEIVCRL